MPKTRLVLFKFWITHILDCPREFVKLAVIGSLICLGKCVAQDPCAYWFLDALECHSMVRARVVLDRESLAHQRHESKITKFDQETHLY